MINNLGAPKIETNRLILRMVSLEDANSFFEFCSNSLACQYLTFNPYFSINQSKRSIENMIRAFLNGTDVNFSIILKEINKVIGTISLNFKTDFKTCEVGYILNPKYWNNGYMDEALKATIKVSFDYYNMNNIIASYVKDNISSEKLLFKNGFKTYEIIENGFQKNHKSYDLIKVSLSK